MQTAFESEFVSSPFDHGLRRTYFRNLTARESTVQIAKVGLHFFDDSPCVP
jgi:hypothetical protein